MSTKKQKAEALILRKFDLKSVRDNSVCVFIGKTHTGKSFCCRDLLYHKADFPVGKAISGTEEANGFYGDFIPKKFISFAYDNRIIDKFIQRQTLITHKKSTDPQFKYMDPRAFLILDDLMYDTSWIKYKRIMQLFMTGRHMHILFVILMQYPLGIPPQLRCNIDYVFLFRDNIIKNRERIFEHYAGMFPSKEVFYATMDKYTESYGCIVIHNGSSSNQIEDQVFQFKATKRDDFKMCDDMCWKLGTDTVVQKYKPSGMFNGI
jgi:hypothetical protein